MLQLLDGSPLREASPVELKPGSGVRNWKSGRIGTVIQTLHGSGKVLIRFEEGDECACLASSVEALDPNADLMVLKASGPARKMPAQRLEGQQDPGAAFMALEAKRPIEVAKGLRVRNWRSGCTGTITGLNERPGHIKVRFDDGAEGPQQVLMLQLLDGSPLRETPLVELTPGLEVRNWKDGRIGTVVQVLHDSDKILLRNEEGNEYECLAANVEAMDGRPLKWLHGPSVTGNRRRWNSRSTQAWTPSASERGWGSWDAYNAQRSQAQGSGGGGRGGGHGGNDDRGGTCGRGAEGGCHGAGNVCELERQALREAAAQLRRPGSQGFVWIRDWRGRYQAALGQLRNVLERHPEEFKVVPGAGRRFTVQLASSGVTAASSETSSDAAQEGKPRKNKIPWAQAIRSIQSPGPMTAEGPQSTGKTDEAVQDRLATSAAGRWLEAAALQ